MNHEELRAQLSVNAELISALKTIIPWAGPHLGASDARLSAIKIAQGASDKAEGVILAQSLRERYGV